MFRNLLSLENTSKGFIPHRFTAKQLAVYGDNPNFRTRSLCPSGTCLDVMIDASGLVLEVEILGKVRPYCYFDLFVNDAFVGSQGASDMALGDHRFNFSFGGDGTQRITIYLPHNIELIIKSINWSDCSRVEPAMPYTGNLLCLGDSITQGMDAVHPSATYPVLLSRKLGMNLLNQGVGGYIFDADSLDPELPYNPDIVTIAYGTNDWGRWSSLDELSERVCAYLERVTATYAAARIYVITPLWRADIAETRPMGTFEEMTRAIAEATRRFPAVQIISGLELLPHDTSFLADKVHPTDSGFHLIADALYTMLEA